MSDLWNPNIDLIEGEIHKHFLREAYLYAWDHSHDPVTKVGALLVSSSLDEIVASGTNHFPDGLFPTILQINDRSWKYAHMIHAERAVILSAQNGGRITQGRIMYLPWVPCTPCAEAIIAAKITLLVGHKEMILKTPKRWWETTEQALALLKQHGIPNLMYYGKIDGVRNMFNGSEWEP